MINMEQAIDIIAASNLRTQVVNHAQLLKHYAKDLREKLRSMKPLSTLEYQQNLAEQARLQGVIDTLIDYLAEEDRKGDIHE